MSQANFTHVKWKMMDDASSPRHRFAIVAFTTEGCKSICDVTAVAWKHGKRKRDPVARAHARLIAASPTLLDALATLVNLHDDVADGGEGITEADWQAAREAIADATGGDK